MKAFGSPAKLFEYYALDVEMRSASSSAEKKREKIVQVIVGFGGGGD